MSFRPFIAFLMPAMLACPALAHGKTGRDLFVSAGCISCHSINCNRTGPGLKGIVSRKAGTAAGYRQYSAAMKRSGIVWSEKMLDAFLADPDKTVPGTTMNSMAIRIRMTDAAERRALIGYLKRQDASLDLCPKK